MTPEQQEIVKSVDESNLDALLHAWDRPPGLYGWLSTVDHAEIGKRFIITAFLFFVLGGILAALMRMQLAFPENHLLGPDRYNQIFTMHGSTMMFLFAVPVMQAMGVYLVPLMVGTRNIAFPRLVAFSYWIYLMGGITIYVFFLLNIGPDAGWFSYVPLAGPEYSPGKRIDIWSQLINFTELSALGAAVSIIATVFKQRAPGMTLDRIPLFVWAMFVTSFMIVVAMPAVMTGSLFLSMDRLVSTQFYNQAEGGDPILWQHLFWFFGHPEVYIIFIPALGMISSIIQAFSGRRVFGYTAMVMALIATSFIAFGLWVHHMFATNLPKLGMSFFSAASVIIAIPTGVQIFCWLATFRLGAARFRTALLFVLAFFFIFVIGGITGIMLGLVPLDLQLHDSYFVVAHLHYVLLGGAVFPLFGAFYFWFPKFTGRMMSERLGAWNFWLMFLGFNLTFFPMHYLGLNGMTRRVYTYLAVMGWDRLNLAATCGALILVLGILVFIVNFFRSIRGGEIAPDNPWGADTLEWETTSPPPCYNFRFVPVVCDSGAAHRPVVRGLKHRQLLVTTAVAATPSSRRMSPGPTIWPLLGALAMTGLFIGSVFTPWAVVYGSVLFGITCIFWGWPEKEEEEIVLALEAEAHG